MNSNKKKKQPNKWLIFLNIPFQMGIIIFLFSVLGKFLDNKFSNTTELFTKIFVLLGVCLALYNVIRQVNQLNKND
jgi:F0F1-type ATP synthase assembly protein I